MTEQRVPNKTTINSVEQMFDPGHIIGGKYKIISILGKGGMGTVYHVLHMFLDTEFALKILDQRRVSDELQVMRFQTEAKSASNLDHPNLIKVHDYGLSDDGEPYLVMDFINGITLADYLKINGQLTEEAAIPIFEQICTGLLYAHEKNLVHRDIKPSNIMLLHDTSAKESDVVKILDFGIAKSTDTEGGEPQNLTRTGEIFGSPLYMSPEQCGDGEIDNRSDIYSLGCVFFEVLTGTPPHVGTTALRTMMLHQTENAPMLTEASLGKKYSDGVERTIHRMLEKDPNQRQRGLDQVLRELKSSARQNQTGAATKTEVKNTKKQRKVVTITVPWAFAAISAIVLTTLVLTIALSEHRQKVVNSMIMRLTPPDPAKKAEVAEKSQTTDAGNTANAVANKLEHYSQKTDLKTAYKNRTITSDMNEVATEAQTRTFKFDEDRSIGTITNHYACFLNPQRTRPFKEEMRGEVKALSGQPLTFHLDGNACPEIFDYPEIIDKVTPAEFAEFALTGNSNVPKPKLQTALKKFLQTIRGWNNLRSLVLYSVSLDDECLKLIDDLKLDSLYLGTVDVDAHKLDSMPFLNRLRSATFEKMNVDKILPALGKAENLTRLDLTQTSFQPASFEKLSSAPSLKFLIIEGTGKVGTISKLKLFKQLNTLYLRHYDLEPSDLPEFAQCHTLKHIMLSRNFIEVFERVNFSDSRVILKNDAPEESSDHNNGATQPNASNSSNAK